MTPCSRRYSSSSRRSGIFGHDYITELINQPNTESLASGIVAIPIGK